MKRLKQVAEREIRKYIKQFEQECGFSDNLLYKRCLEAAKEIELCEINEKNVRGPINTFLLNWGMMGRVLRGKAGWEKELSEEIKRNFNLLEDFRKQDLGAVVIESFEGNIKECYKSLKKIVGPTSATKVLHLICPNFFPMWDADIRKEVSKEISGRGERGIGNSEKGYYRFALEMKNLLGEYDSILSGLSREYGKGKLKLLDEYLWWVTRRRKQSARRITTG